LPGITHWSSDVVEDVLVDVVDCAFVVVEVLVLLDVVVIDVVVVDIAVVDVFVDVVVVVVLVVVVVVVVGYATMKFIPASLIAERSQDRWSEKEQFW